MFETDSEDLIKKFRKFSDRSRKKYKDLLERIKTDRAILAGDQWSKEDTEILGKDRTAFQLNVVRNAVRTIVNTYLTNTYAWHVPGMSDMDKAGIKFLKDPDNTTATVEALSSSVEAGLGILVMSTDYRADCMIEPVMYSVEDVEKVYLDPDLNKRNGSDQEQCAIVELKSKKWIRDHYGDIDVEQPTVDIPDDYDRKNYAPLVTYYVRGDNGVYVFKLIGRDIVETVELPLTYIPVIPVFGEKIWDEDGEVTYTGIVSQMEGIQRLINYGYNNLIERLATNPKNLWLTDIDSIEGDIKDYENAPKNGKPILTYKSVSDDGKRELKPPQKLSNAVEIGDVSELFAQSLQMVNSVVGIPSVGLETDVEKSATEVLTNEKTFNNNVRGYMQNLRFSLQVAGMCFFELLLGRKLYGKIRIEIVEGPDEALKKQEARVVLQGLGQFVDTPEDKRKLMIAQAMIEKDNEWVMNFANMLQPMPTAQEMQDQELLSQANNEIKQRDVQIAQLSKQLEDQKREADLKAYSLERELTLQNIKHQQEMEKMLLQHRLDGQLTDADLMKMSIDSQKNQMDLEQKAIELDVAKQKAEAENFKTAGQMAVTDAKTRNELAKQETIRLKGNK